MGRIFLRGDGNLTIGLGHLSRLLALASYLKSSFEVILIIKEGYENFNLIKSSKIPVFKLPQGSDLIDEPQIIDENFVFTKQDIVVIDGYQFSSDYEDLLNKIGVITVRIFDLVDKKMNSRILINHGLSSLPDSFKSNTGQKFYLGLDYLMINAVFFEIPILQFNKWRTKKKRILLAFGGADPFDISSRYTQFLSNYDQFSIDLVLPRPRMESYQVKFPKVNFHTELNVDDIVALMDTCDFGIFSASTIALEAAARQLPMAIGYFVDNQQNIYDLLLSKKLALGLDELSLFNEEKRKNLLVMLNNEAVWLQLQVAQSGIDNPKNNFINLFKQITI